MVGSWEPPSLRVPAGTGEQTISQPVECLVHANVRIADAFGYWPTRSFRASEETAAAAYVALYRSLGGRRAESNV